MILRIDIGVVPPRLTLQGADDLQSFKTQVLLAPHTWVSSATLESLGPEDPDWKKRLDAMIAYAGDHGWTDEGGRVRAHVEVLDEGSAAN